MIYINFLNDKEKGILKKINSQKKALENLGLRVSLTENLNGVYFLNDIKLGNCSKENRFIDKVIRKFQGLKILRNLKNYYLYKEKSVVYIRYFLSSPFLISYLKFLKKINLKIILEIPTYPYDNEIKNKHIFIKMDKKYRLQLYKYVDRVVTYSQDKNIWGIPCINISNGIDLDNIKVILKSNNKKNNIIFTSVSNCYFWHGLDRFLLSLKEYEKNINKKEVLFNIVGEGAEIRRLKEIVNKNSYLKSIVVFYGFKEAEDLDKIYNKTDIGVGSLARHRSGLYTMMPLKNREYCAKGIPMIFSEDDPDLRNVPFVYHLSANEELIDIEAVIDWYENLNTTSEEIREYSKIFSWDIQMKKVVEEIENL